MNVSRLCFPFLALAACSTARPVGTPPPAEPETEALRTPAGPVALSALEVLKARFQVCQNNLANVMTPAFKRSRVEVTNLGYDVRRSAGLEPDAAGSAGPAAPAAFELGTGARVGAVTRLHTQGGLESTGRNLDVAIEGNGFFVVQLRDASTGYTRDGRLHIDSDGRIATAQGGVLQPEITVPQDLLELNVDPEGRVTGRTAGAPDSTQQFGQMQLARVINPAGLRAASDGIYQLTAAAGQPLVASPGNSGLGFVKQAFLERSNVEFERELIEWREAEREYRLLMQLVFGRELAVAAPPAAPH